MDEGEKDVQPQDKEKEKLEEGEIVDYFDIISSEEESSMRARIQELEDKNKEIEQITVISKSFANPHDYACQYNSYKPNHNYSNTNSRIPPYPIISRNRSYDMRGGDDDSDDLSVSSLDEITTKSSNMRQKRNMKYTLNQRRRKRHHYSSRSKVGIPLDYHYYHSIYDSHRVDDYQSYSHYNMNANYENYQKLPPYTLSNNNFHLKRRMNYAHSYEHLPIETKRKRLTHKKLVEDTSNSIRQNNLSYRSNVSSISDSDNYRSNDFYLDRELLHLAITRNTNNPMTNKRYVEIAKNSSGNLRERLLPMAETMRINICKSPIDNKNSAQDKPLNYDKKRENNENNNYKDNDDVNQNEESVGAKSTDMLISNDDSDSLDEKELRLVALKSAVLKKHQRRNNCRDPQTAYSPTDFEAMINSGIMDNDVQCNLDLDLVEQALNEEGMSPSTTISLLCSPKSQLPDTESNGNHPSIVNTKPIDMDIDNSVSEEEENCIKWDSAMNNFNHTALPLNENEVVNELSPLNYEDQPRNSTGTQDEEDFRNKLIENNNPMLVAIENAETKCVSDKFLHLNAMESSKCLSETSPKLNNDQMQQEMDICTPLSVLSENNDNNDEEEEDDDCILVSELWPKSSIKSDDNVIVLLDDDDDDDNENIVDIKSTDVKIDENKEDEEEEELALRALLLSRMQSPKYKNNLKFNSKSFNNMEEVDSEAKTDDVSIIREELPELPINKTESETSSLDSSIQKVSKNDMKRNILLSPGSEILKKAVLRFNQEKELAKQFKCKEVKDKTIEITSSQEIIEESEQNNEDLPQTTYQENNEKSKQDDEVDSSKLEENKNNQQQGKDRLLSSVAKENQEENATNIKCNKEHGNKENTLSTITNIKTKTPEKTKNPISKTANKKSIPSSVTTSSTTTLTKTVTSISNRIMTTCKKQQILQRKTFPTYNLSRTAKIVKPNKVINRTHKILNSAKLAQPLVVTGNKVINKSVISNAQTKSILTSSNLSKELKTIAKDINNDKVTNNSNTSSETRLITSIEEAQSMFQIPKLVINLRPDTSTGDSATSSSSDECSEEMNSSKPTDKPQFSEKVDKFLQTIRSQTGTQQKSLKKVQNSTNGQLPDQKQTENSVNVTPLAVRHLPASAQAEYRNLVYRMKMLENKRMMNSVKNLFKDKTGEKPSSSNNERLYEEMLMKVGNNFIKQSDGTLQLLAKAKELKCSKFVIEKRLNLLKKEIGRVRQLDRDLKAQISALFPEVGQKTKNLTVMRGKFNKLYSFVLSTDKNFNGLNKKIINELNDNVMKKNAELTRNIKFVNSLRIDNFKLLEDKMPKQQQQQQTANEKISKKMIPCEENNKDVEANEPHKSQHLEEFQVKNGCNLKGNLNKAKTVDDNNINGSTAYESPLECLKINNSGINPNIKLCPYALMGQCEDNKCKYWHLPNKKLTSNKFQKK